MFASVSEYFRGLPSLNRAYQKNEQILKDVYLTDQFRVFYEKIMKEEEKKYLTEDEIVIFSEQ